MLKKNVKYGNSSALILDKALLELLNIAEGSVVKIKTDGISLIITPQNMLVKETISPTIEIESTLNDALKNSCAQSFNGDFKKAEAFQESLNEISCRYKKILEENNNKTELRALAIEQMNQEMDILVKKYSPEILQDLDNTDLGTFREGFAEIHKKYQPLISKVNALVETPEYIHEMALLAEKYQNVPDAIHSKEYLEMYTQLIAKHIPEYAAYQEELKKMCDKCGQHVKKMSPPAHA